MNYIRLKRSVPFSKRLNEWIKERVKDVSIIETEDQMPLDELEAFYKTHGVLYINNQFCDNTIFGDPATNIMFRAWHDLIHIELGEGFDYMQEARVAFKQIAELPEDWREEKLLILSEIIGQAAHHEKYDKFVDDQRMFTVNLLETGNI